MITVYSKNQCPFCDRAKQLLESREVKFTEINVSENPEAREYLLEQGLRSVPQIYRGTTLIPGGYQGLAGLSEDEFNKIVCSKECL
jgi:glutaredoxin